MSWIEIPENEIVGSFNLSELNVDQAYFNYSSEASTPLWLYELSSNCHKCPYKLVKNEEVPLTISTIFPMKFRFRTSRSEDYAPEDGDMDRFCDLDYNFGEFGVYNWHASGSPNSSNCTFSVTAKPVNIYLPLALVAMFYVVLFTLCYFVISAGYKHIPRFSKRSRSTQPQPSAGNVNLGYRPNSSPVTSNNLEPQNDENKVSEESPQHSGDDKGNLMPTASQSSLSVPQTPSSKQRQRLRSLDTFRGIAIVIMIFVNDGGGHYYFFEHATWDGLYVADLVFPWFLWIMGVCIPIAIKSQVKKGTPGLKIFSTIAIRSAKLIALGILLNSTHSPVQFGTGANLRIPGVLQRFGICYLVCASMVLVGMSVNVAKPEGSKVKALFQDIWILWISWIIAVIILAIHTFITFMLPIEGCPTGYLGPGGMHNNNSVAKSCTGGASGYIDLQIFSIKHIYQWPTSKAVYESEPYDPEGFLGSLTSIFQVWIGVQAGATMMVYPRPSSRLIRWGSWAIVTGLAGVLLSGIVFGGGNEASMGLIPINKNLWSLSFVLVTTSFAFILLSILYIMIDIKKWWSGSPFFEPGMNSILLYLGHSIFTSALPWHWRIGRMETHFVRVSEALWGTSLWVLTAIWLHHKKTYWSL